MFKFVTTNDIFIIDMQFNIYKKEWNLNEDYINSWISKQQLVYT